jgi:hypothetical protein
MIIGQLIFSFLLLTILSICIGCNSTNLAKHYIKYDCTNSKNEIVGTKEEAVEIANYFLEQSADINYYKDSVTVIQNEDGDYQVSFPKKDFSLPGIIMLMVRKDDGCIALLPSE